MLRDPRDVVVSMYHYFGRRHAEKLNLDHEEKNAITLASHYQWYNAANEKMPNGPYLRSDYQQFLDWKKLPNVFFTSYEALVGSKGGGSDKRQRAEIRRIADFSYLAIGDEQLIKGSERSIWNKHFLPQHLETAPLVPGRLILIRSMLRHLKYGPVICLSNSGMSRVMSGALIYYKESAANCNCSIHVYHVSMVLFSGCCFLPIAKARGLRSMILMKKINFQKAKQRSVPGVFLQLQKHLVLAPVIRNSLE